MIFLIYWVQSISLGSINQSTTTTMRKFIYLMVSLTLVGTLFAASNNGVVFSENGETVIELNHSKSSEISVTFNVNGYQLSNVTTPLGQEAIARVMEGTPILEKGMPNLSKLTSSVIIPNTGNTEVVVSQSDFIEIKGVKIAPSKGNLYRNQDPDQVEYYYGEAYEKNQFYPGKLAELREPYILRDFRGQTIVTYPLQYNPVTEVLRVYTTIKVNVKVVEGQSKNTLESNKKRITPEYNQIYSRHFLNYGSQKYTPIGEEGNMLIICPADYMDEMQPFVNWKTKKGLSVEMVEYSSSTTGTAADDIKTYVDNYYNTNGLTFLLFVGDGEDIPSLYASGDSDVAYSYVEGDDAYPEFFVGRFSAETANDVTTQVNRIVFYERDMDASATWLSNALGIASNEGGPGQGDDDESDIEHMNNIKTDLLGYTFSEVGEAYDPGAAATDVSDVVNPGAALINYVGHGSNTSWSTTGFNIDDCYALTNENKLPYIFDVACVNGNFHGQTCFAEAWMRATYNNNPTGAISIIASTINQSWAPPMDGQDEMNDILVESYTDNIKRTFGGVAYNGCLHMNDEYGAEGDEMTDTWTTFGDPSVMLRTAAPTSMVVSHDSEILIGMNNLTVSCDENNALVSLTNNGAPVATAYVSGGQATLTFDAFDDVGTLDLVVTAYNKITYSNTIEIIPAAGPFISVQGFQVLDLAGNNNGAIDYNEDFILDISVKNVGVELASNVQATLTTADSHFTVNQGSFTYGDVAEGAIIDGSNFELSVDNNLPDGYLGEVEITFTDADDNVWTKTLTLRVNAPNITFTSSELIEDGTYGDGNGRLDPGESAYLNLTVLNDGSSVADIINIALSGESPYVSIEQPNTGLEALGIEQTEVIPFKLSAHEATPEGTFANINYLATANIETLDGTTVVVGQLPELQLGDETNPVATYPFHNYYENNKSQLLYLASEFTAGTHNIQEIAFDIATFTENESHRDLANFTVKMATTSITEMGGSFEPTASAQEVYFEEIYMLPAQTGWSAIDIQDFEYNTAQGNLLIEITWGDNGEFCASTDKTTVNTTTTSVATVAYGSADNETPPVYDGNSTARPNIKFTFESQGSTIEPVNLNVLAAGSGLPIEDAMITIGSQTMISDAEGLVSLNLAHGTYNVTAIKDLYFNYQGTIIVTADQTTFNLSMVTLGDTYDVQFTMLDGIDELPDVAVTFNNDTKFTQVTGTVTFNYVPEGEWGYLAEKEGYYPLSGTVTVEENTTLTLNMDIIPVYDVMFVAADQGEPVAGAQVTFNNSIEVTDEQGQAVFEHVEVGENLVYEVTKAGYIHFIDSLNLVDEDVWQDVPLQFIPDLAVNVTNQYGIMEDAKVLFQGHIKYSDAEGNVLFADVEQGAEQVIKIYQTNYYTIYDTVDVLNENLSFDYYLKKKTDLTLTVMSNDEVMESASVFLNGKEKITDAEGQVIFTAVESGEDIPCRVEMEGYYTAYDTMDITYDDMAHVMTITAIPDVTFSVTDGELPIEMANVTMQGVNQRTNEQGMVIYNDIEPGYWTYNIEKEGYYPILDSLLMADNDTTLSITMQLIPDVNLVITDGELPIAGAIVELNGITEVSNTEGAVEFLDVEAGKYGYKVTKDKMVTIEDTLLVESDDYTDTIEMQLLTYKYTVTITDGNNYLQGAEVVVNNETKTTNDTGTVIFNLPIASDYTCTINKEGYYAETTNFDIVDADVQEEIQLTLITYTVFVKVTDSDGPLEGATILFMDKQKTTNALGEAEFMDIIPTDSTGISIRKEGYVELQSSVMVDSIEHFEFNMTKVGVNGKMLSEINIYPNPTDGEFNVHLANVGAEVKAYVFNSIGKLMVEKTINTNTATIDLSPYPKGNYMVKIVTQNKTLSKLVIVY